MLPPESGSVAQSAEHPAFTRAVAGSLPAAPMKTCSRCRIPKGMDQFADRAKSSDGKQVYCRECQAGYYQKNRARLLPKIKAANKLTKLAITEFVDEYKRAHPCERCGESDPCALDFHHPSGTKEFGVGEAVRNGATLKRVKDEVSKCRVLCASCHRKLHAGRFALEAR